MADTLGTMLQNANTVASSMDLMGTVKQGMGLAQAADKLQEQKMQLEEQKSQLALGKYNKAINVMNNLVRAGKNAPMFVPWAEKTLASLDVPMSRVNLEMMAKDENIQNLWRSVLPAIRGQTKNPEEALQGLFRAGEAGVLPEVLEGLKSQTKYESAAELAAQKAAQQTGTRAAGETRRGQQFETSRVDKSQNEIRKTLSKPTEKFVSTMSSLNNLEGVLKKGMHRDVKMLGASIAKDVMGMVGTLTDRDIQMAFPSTIAATKADLLTWLNKNPKMDKTTQASLMRLVEQSKAKQVNNYRQFVDLQKTLYMKSAVGENPATSRYFDTVLSEAEALANLGQRRKAPGTAAIESPGAAAQIPVSATPHPLVTPRPAPVTSVKAPPGERDDVGTLPDGPSPTKVLERLYAAKASDAEIRAVLKSGGATDRSVDNLLKNNPRPR